MTVSDAAAVIGLDEIDADSETGEALRARPVEAVPAPPRRDIDKTKTRSERLAEMARAKAEMNGGEG